MNINKKILPILLCFTMLISNLVPVHAATNLAFGKYAFASSHYDEAGNYTPEKVTDGNYNNIWSMGSIPLTGARGGVEQYVAVDLGEAYMLDTIVAATRRGLDDLNARSGWYAQVANDEYFTDAVTIRAGYSTVEYEGNYTFFCEFDVPYRYVRICSPNYFTVAEIEVYGEKYDPTTMNRKSVFSDTKNKFYQPGAMLLSALNIMTGISKTEFAGERILTRAQTARIMTEFSQIPLKKADEQIFSDVGIDHWAADYIYTATKAGIISVDENFRPNDYVTDKEFLKLVLYAMGYGEYVEYCGGWDKGVYDVSSQFSLTKGANVTKQENLTRGSAAMILFNALNTPLLEIQTFTTNKGYHVGQSDETILESKFGLTVVTGLMTENSTTSLIRSVNNGAGTVKIGNSKYYEPDQIMEFWIGMNVGVAVDVDTNKQISAAWVDTKKTETIKIYDYQRLDVDKKRYEYEDDNERKKTLKLSDEMFLIKNNSAITDWTKNDLICEDGYIEFVDNNGDGVYDVALCFEPQVMVANFASNYDGNVNVVAIDGAKVSADDLNYLCITKNGKNSTAGRIAKNDIVKVYQSSCGRSLWIDVYSNSRTATIGSISDEEAELDGVLTGYTEFYKNNKYRTDSLLPGNQMTILLDESDRIVWVLPGSDIGTKETIGYIINITHDNDKSNLPLRFKFYTQYGTFATYDAADKIVVDGKRYKMDDLRAMFYNNILDIEGEFAMFKVNKEGLLVTLDTENTDLEKNSKIIPITDSTGKKLSFIAYGSNFGNIHNYPAGAGIYENTYLQQPLKGDTLAFVIPVDENNDPVDAGYEEFYKVSTAEHVWTALDPITERSEFYGPDYDNYPTFGVRYKTYATASASGVRAVDDNDAKGMVVKKVVTSLNDDDEIVKVIHGYNIEDGRETVISTDGNLTRFIETGRIQQERSEWINGETKYLQLPTKSDPTEASEQELQFESYCKDVSSLKKGDIILYQLVGNYINSLERVFSIDDVDYSTYQSYYGSYYTSGSKGSYPQTIGASFKLMYGKVLSVRGDTIKYQNDPQGSGTSKFPMQIPYKNMSMVFVIKDGDITVDSASNLPAFVSAGSEMVVYTSTGYFRSAVVYE